MSVVSAIIVVRRHLSGIGPATRVAGTPLVARQLHALADAGMRQATIYGDLTPEEALDIISEEVEERIEVQLARVRPGETELLAMRRLAGAAEGAVLLVPGDVFVDADVFRNLMMDTSFVPPTLVLSAEGYTGVGIVDLESISGLGGSLEYIDDFAAMAERGEAGIATAQGTCRRLWEHSEVAEVERALIDDALSLPGEPELWRRLVAPIRRELLPTTLERPGAPHVLSWVGGALAACAVVAAYLGGRAADTLGPLAFALSSLAAGIEMPLHRALRIEAHVYRTRPGVRYGMWLVLLLLAFTLRLQALDPPPQWVVLVGGAAVWATFLVTCSFWLTERTVRYVDALEALGPPLGGAATSWLRGFAWLARAPFPGIGLATLWLAGAIPVALVAAAICGGLALFAWSAAIVFIAVGSRRPVWPETGAPEPKWLDDATEVGEDAEAPEAPEAPRGKAAWMVERERVALGTDRRFRLRSARRDSQRAPEPAVSAAATPSNDSSGAAREADWAAEVSDSGVVVADAMPEPQVHPQAEPLAPPIDTAEYAHDAAGERRPAIETAELAPSPATSARAAAMAGIETAEFEDDLFEDATELADPSSADPSSADPSKSTR